jgi:RNA polymerase sigma factor (sigma-70 family)
VNSVSATTGTVRLDSDLIKRAQQGDSDAFAALFHTQKERIYSVCLRMTNNAAEAEDLTQDAFLQVFRKIATFRGDSAFSTWVHRIAVNTVLMHFRKKSLYKFLWTNRTATATAPRYAANTERKIIAWQVASTGSHWPVPSKTFPTDAGQSSCCTKSRAMRIRKSQRCSVAPWATRSRNCTRPDCEFVGYWRIRQKRGPQPSEVSGRAPNTKDHHTMGGLCQSAKM